MIEIPDLFVPDILKKGEEKRDLDLETQISKKLNKEDTYIFRKIISVKLFCIKN